MLPNRINTGGGSHSGASTFLDWKCAGEIFLSDLNFEGNLQNSISDANAPCVLGE
jgi:hypothetical protein